VADITLAADGHDSFADGPQCGNHGFSLRTRRAMNNIRHFNVPRVTEDGALRVVEGFGTTPAPVTSCTIGGECRVGDNENVIAPLPSCGVARFLILLEGPWATLIVRELLHGPHRFSRLRDALPGISPHTLTSRLRRFEKVGVVRRSVFSEVPPRVEYELTELGESLRPVLEAMATWALTVNVDAKTG
jgi:DNA-binding HxlR family transcriptional regulator